MRRSPNPDESEARRVVRNFDELLQELRVMQTGVQILLGFLLTLPFTPVFDGISDDEKSAYGLVIIAAVAATALLISPVVVHRATFRMQMKPTVLKVSHSLALAGVAALLVAVVAAVGLASSVALDGDRWIWLTSVTAAMLMLLWLALPIALRLRGPDADDRRHDPELAQD